MTSACDEPSWLSSVSLSPMRRGDLRSVLAIEHVSFPSAWSLQSYVRELHNPNSHYFVARLGDEVIGYAGMWIVADEAHISTLAVAPARRRRGLGRRLLEHLMEVAQRQGASHMTLEVREANAVARALYEQLSFEARAVLPRYYGDTGENAVVMWRALPSAENG